MKVEVDTSQIHQLEESLRMLERQIGALLVKIPDTEVVVTAQELMTAPPWQSRREPGGGVKLILLGDRPKADHGHEHEHEGEEE